MRADARNACALAVDPAARRAQPQARDGRLDGMAQRWLAAFPNSFRPTALAEKFPRIANRIALCWSDPVLSGQVLNELLLDKRGGRQGFPRDVRDELLGLRDRAHLPRQPGAGQRQPPHGQPGG